MNYSTGNAIRIRDHVVHRQHDNLRFEGQHKHRDHVDGAEPDGYQRHELGQESRGLDHIRVFRGLLGWYVSLGILCRSVSLLTNLIHTLLILR